MFTDDWKPLRSRRDPFRARPFVRVDSYETKPRFGEMTYYVMQT